MALLPFAQSCVWGLEIPPEHCTSPGWFLEKKIGVGWGGGGWGGGGGGGGVGGRVPIRDQNHRVSRAGLL